MASLAVVILNWNGKELLKEFLPQVLDNSANFDIVVVDNNSIDGSVELLREYFPNVIILQLDNNYGFAGGYNRALLELNYEYVILLNSDVAPSSKWIEPLVSVLDNDQTIAVAVPKILDYKNPSLFEYAGAAGGFIDYLGYPFCRGRVFDMLEVDNGQYDDSMELFWASGAAFAVRRELFLSVGGFDEDFFAHQEEIDLCWRIQKWGYKIQYVPQSSVFHLGGGTLGHENPRKTYLNFRNSLFMILKNQHSEIYKTLFFRMLLDGVAAAKYLLTLDFANFSAVFRAHIHFYNKFSLFYKKRCELRNMSGDHNVSTIFPKSIVLQYFLFRKRTYQMLAEAAKVH